MPAIAFFPWAQLEEQIVVGRFVLTPMIVAEKNGGISAELLPAVRAVLAPYQARPNAKLDRIPLLHRVGTEVCGELDDDSAAELFAFRQRLAFAALAAREFFAGPSSYCNSDNFALVAQGFTPELAGAALIVSRRRDGSVRNLVSATARQEQRPPHVSAAAVMPHAIDIVLLHSLEAAAGSDYSAWPRLEEALTLFVGANTDSSGVALHGELVDLVSAFGRLADAWKEDEIVEWFVETLPGPEKPNLDLGGPKLAQPRLQSALERNPSIRAAWLADAYRLRSEHAHGRVSMPRYPAIWSAREHLLLGAVSFPLVVKTMLLRAGLYSWTPHDSLLNEAFDALATLEPFGEPSPAQDPEDDVEIYPWREVFTAIQFRRFVDHIGAQLPDDIANPEP